VTQSAPNIPESSTVLLFGSVSGNWTRRVPPIR